MKIHPTLVSLALCAVVSISTPALAGSRKLVPDDYYRFLNVTEPKVAADGTVAYLVTTNDRDSDAARGTVWVVNWDGTDDRAVTRGESANHPDFSPTADI